MEAIWDSAVYVQELTSGHIPGLHYLISWKSYPKEDNTWEPILIVQHLQKLLSTFHKDYSRKPTVTSASINLVSPMAKSSAKPIGAKQKHGQKTGTSKHAKKNWVFWFWLQAWVLVVSLFSVLLKRRLSQYGFSKRVKSR